jgi:TonB dependent receptor
VTTLADNFGERTEIYQGLDLTVNGRLESTTISGGVNLGRTATNDCQIITDSPQKQFCDVAPPFFQPDLKLSASRALPWDMQVSATLQSSPGPQITASYTIRSNQTIGLGRPLSGGTAVVALIEPGTMYNDRYTQLDARLTKAMQFGTRSRLRLMADVYNLFNAATSLSHSNTFGGQWLRPQTIMPGRFVKFGMQMDF